MAKRISNFKASQRNYPELIRNALRDCGPEQVDHVFVGVDEGLNHPRIFQMLEGLIADGTIRSAGPLWTEVRMMNDSSWGYIYGGVTKRNKRNQLVLMGEIGKPIPGISDDDPSVLDFLIVHFLSFGKVVFLTGDKSFDLRGKYFGPLLSDHHPSLSLTAIYKENSCIEKYCAEVENFLIAGAFKPGYAEKRIYE